ncbi:DUF11 domain-containing protein [Paludisphaera mucosa]|uniref:DUF11 domain-containing protein n=1 Tax=Paludisphaera mucosa TaxID=3030827 RepID=A0ABT6FA16_9BACT|nr:DUF11 domain-containing protein [Paludisphaera mucosa]MDG3004225.1 DUF11 domain-containing protein [Paludisphaera mucosa]
MTMGRRLFFVLGMVLLIACGPARVLGAQDGLSDPAEAPASLPPAAAVPAPEEPADLPPARDPLPGMDDAAAPAPAPAPSRAKAKAARPDPAVERTQAPAAAPAAAPAPAPASAPAGDGAFLQPNERLPLGKHEVLVSVEVQAPAEMNLNREAAAKIIVVNSGSADAFNVVVRDELPPGLTFVSSSPAPEGAQQGVLTWRLGTLPAGQSKTIPMRVTPTQVVHVDHGVTVSFQAGSKARTLVREPKLKVEVVQSPSIPKQLKGKPVEFRISVTNTGDGPARNVLVLAKLSPGLSHESGERNDQNSLEHPIDRLGAGERVDLPALRVDAKQGGRQACTVKATSPDVVPNPADAEVERVVDVVEAKLKILLTAVEKRFTDTIAPYEVSIENPGTAPARNVKVQVALPVSGRLVAQPPDALWDRKTQRLNWSIAELAPGEPPRTLKFDVRMGDVGFYEVTAEAKADNVAVERDKRSTDVQGMADVDIVVQERRRVVDVGNETTFLVKLHNYGTKEAVNVDVNAAVSPNLQITETSGGPEGESKGPADGSQVSFPKIDRLGPNASVTLGIKVKAKNLGDGIGVCTVSVKHNDLTTELKGMANVKVTEGRRTADAAEPRAK